MNITVTLLLIFGSSLILTAIVIPTVIKTAFKKRLLDAPNESRKVHKKVIPNLGGIAIFAGFMFCQQLFIHAKDLPALNQLLMCGCILFMLGLKDDIVGLSPYKKFVAQFVAAIIVAVIGNIRIMNMDGFLGIYELSYAFSVSLTVFSIVGIVNAFNLVDGIDGLAGMLGLIIFLAFAFLFYNTDEKGWAFLCLSLAGSLVGFLMYNISPARIFMGDSGSLLIGFFVAVSTIQLINMVSLHPIHTDLGTVSSPTGLAMGALIVPLFDTLRVFTLRILDNRSPFEADRNHLHHRLLHAGLSHTRAMSVLSLLTLGFLILAFFLQDIGSNQLVATLSIIILTLNTAFTLYMNSITAPGAAAESSDSDDDRPGMGESTPRKLSKEEEEFSESVLNKIFPN